MATFFGVLIGIIGILIALGLMSWPIVVWLMAGEDWDWRVRTRILHTVGAIVALAMLIAFAINSGMFSSDNASHCGPGTRYVSESHYNVATKTTVTDWMCVR